jgi:hypothetical protein
VTVVKSVQKVSALREEAVQKLREFLRNFMFSTSRLLDFLISIDYNASNASVSSKFIPRFIQKTKIFSIFLLKVSKLENLQLISLSADVYFGSIFSL